VGHRTVQEWVGWYRGGGPDEVARRRHGGLRWTILEPLTPEQEADLRARASTAGFATVKAAVAWAAEALGVRLTEHRMARQFRRLRLRSKVPRPISDRAGRATQAVWKKGYAAASGRSPGG
jgi:hypothetical protein